MGTSHSGRCLFSWEHINTNKELERTRFMLPWPTHECYFKYEISIQGSELSVAAGRGTPVRKHAQEILLKVVISVPLTQRSPCSLPKTASDTSHRRGFMQVVWSDKSIQFFYFYFYTFCPKKLLQNNILEWDEFETEQFERTKSPQLWIIR